MTRQSVITLALAISAALTSQALAATDGSNQQTNQSAQGAAKSAGDGAAPAAGMKPSAAKQVFDMSDIDTGANACRSFGAFMNAKWIAANPIPPDHSTWGEFSELAEKSLDDQHKIVAAAARNASAAKPGSIQQKIGRLYASGMDEKAVNAAGYDPIKPELARITAIKTRAQIAPYLAAAFARGNGQVFDLDASPDYKNATRVIAYAYQGGLGLPTPQYYTDKQYAPQRKAYVGYIASTLRMIGEPKDQAEQHAQAVLDFETKLAKASFSQVEMRDPKNQYHFVSLKAANKATPNFDWRQFWQAQNADIRQGFSLSEPKFFKEFDKLLGNAPLAQWQAYLSFHTVDNAAPYLAKNFSDNRFAFYGKTLSGQPQQEARWKQVLGAVNSGMGEALGQLYVARYFPPEAKARAEKLVHNVRLALKTRLQNVAWMSQETRDKALDKWQKFLPKIGYPSNWRSWQDLDITRNDFFANMQGAAVFNHAYEMAYVGQHRDRQRWGMTPQTVNAYYQPTDNTINFPAAILQPPFFYPTATTRSTTAASVRSSATNPATATTTRAASSTATATTSTGGPRRTAGPSMRAPGNWCSSSTSTPRSPTSPTCTSTANSRSARTSPIWTA